jgi:Ca-activated chloride channel family protein
MARGLHEHEELQRRREAFMRWLALVLLLVPGLVWGPAEAATVEPRDARAGSLFLRGLPESEPIEALRVASEFHARVTGNIARVQVTQTFSNPTGDWLEGLYVFPLAADSAVDELEMLIGERVIRGEIQPREQARAIYEQARQEGRRASLVDQERPNIFTTAVANIAPRSEITIRIAYLEVIPPRDGRYALKLPLAITPRYTPGVMLDPAAPLAVVDAARANAMLGTTATPERVTADVQRVRISVELAPGFELGGLRSLYHEVAIEEGESGRRVSLAGKDLPADRDFELVWTPVVAQDTQAALFTEQSGDETFALLMLTPPDAPPGEVPPREVIFIIDTSGSMGGPPIVQAKAALQLGVDRLAPGDRFDIIRFDNHATRLFAEPQPAGPAAREAAWRFIAALQADGGTEMRAALEMAFATPPPADALRQIVFVTDGSVANEAELVAMIGRRLGDARLFTVGIGAAPNAWFMHEAALAGRGSYTFIAQAVQVRERMEALFRKLERPALVGLELYWQGLAEADLATPLPRDLYAGEPLVMAMRLPQGPSGLLTLSGNSRTGAWLRQLPMQELEGEVGIARLWARERIAELGRQKRLGLSPGPGEGGFDARMLELAMHYGLVSEKTSLVAVDVTPARPAGLPDRQAQAPTSAPAGGAWAHSTGFPVTATPAALWLLSALLALLLAALLLVTRPQSDWCT